MRSTGVLLAIGLAALSSPSYADTCESFSIWGPFTGEVCFDPGKEVSFTGSVFGLPIHREKNFWAYNKQQVIEKDIAIAGAGPTGHGIRIRTQLIVSDINFGISEWHKAGDFRFALADWDVTGHVPQCVFPDITDWGSPCWEEGSWHYHSW